MTEETPNSRQIQCNQQLSFKPHYSFKPVWICFVDFCVLQIIFQTLMSNIKHQVIACSIDTVKCEYGCQPFNGNHSWNSITPSDGLSCMPSQLCLIWHGFSPGSRRIPSQVLCDDNKGWCKCDVCPTPAGIHLQESFWVWTQPMREGVTM